MDDDANETEIQRATEKCEIETAESTVPSGREESKTQLNWSELPSIPLEKIFCFLNHFDRVNMSLVCRNWSEGYGSPSLWKTFRFDLTESMISENSSPVMKFVRKNSKMFQHVEIEYSLSLPDSIELINSWCNLFREFLEILAEKSQLFSFKIHNLFLCFMHVDTSTSVDVKRAISTFLESQHYLKKIELNFFSNQYHDYEKILKDMNENCRDSIWGIGLYGLNVCDIYIEEEELTNENCLLTILKFPHLEILSIEYSLIFEVTFSSQSLIMETLKNYENRSNLLIINLTYDFCHYFNKFKGLTSTDWQFLKTLFPNMRVHLNFKFYQSYLRDVEMLFVPDMPIVYLYLTLNQFRFQHIDSVYKEIEVLFGRLLQSMGTDLLESFCIDWAFPMPDFISILFPFILAFKRLKFLGVFMTPFSTNVHLLMESLLECRPESLKEVCLTISNVENDHDYKSIEKVTRQYVYRLKLMGLSLKVNIYKK